MTTTSWCPLCYRDLDPTATDCDCGWVNECPLCENVLALDELCGCSTGPERWEDERERDDDDGRTYADPRDEREERR